MIGIVIVAHGGLAPELKRAAEHVVGERGMQCGVDLCGGGFRRFAETDGERSVIPYEVDRSD